MAYFIDGKDSTNYVEKVCTNCQHYKNGMYKGEDCPILEIHKQYNRDGGNGTRDLEIEDILSILIPRSENGMVNLECSMFIREAK